MKNIFNYTEEKMEDDNNYDTGTAYKPSKYDYRGFDYGDNENYKVIYQTFAWGCGEKGQLGLGNKRYVTLQRNIVPSNLELNAHYLHHPISFS